MGLPAVVVPRSGRRPAASETAGATAATEALADNTNPEPAQVAAQVEAQAVGTGAAEPAGAPGRAAERPMDTAAGGLGAVAAQLAADKAAREPVAGKPAEPVALAACRKMPDRLGA